MVAASLARQLERPRPPTVAGCLGLGTISQESWRFSSRSPESPVAKAHLLAGTGVGLQESHSRRLPWLQPECASLHPEITLKSFGSWQVLKAAANPTSVWAVGLS